MYVIRMAGMRAAKQAVFFLSVFLEFAYTQRLFIFAKSVKATFQDLCFVVIIVHTQMILRKSDLVSHTHTVRVVLMSRCVLSAPEYRKHSNVRTSLDLLSSCCVVSFFPHDVYSSHIQPQN